MISHLNLIILLKNRQMKTRFSSFRISPSWLFLWLLGLYLAFFVLLLFLAKAKLYANPFNLFLFKYWLDFVVVGLWTVGNFVVCYPFLKGAKGIGRKAALMGAICIAILLVCVGYKWLTYLFGFMFDYFNMLFFDGESMFFYIVRRISG